jgi:hypothetical protein
MPRIRPWIERRILGLEIVDENLIEPRLAIPLEPRQVELTNSTLPAAAIINTSPSPAMSSAVTTAPKSGGVHSAVTARRNSAG